jgi:hypothetical protein
MTVKFGTYAEVFKIYMEQQALIPLFILNGLKSGVVHTKLETVSGPEALALPTVKTW